MSYEIAQVWPIRPNWKHSRSPRSPNAPRSHFRKAGSTRRTSERCTGTCFQDVYDWAGEPRVIRIFKDGIPFGYPETFDAELARVFGWLKDQNFLRERDAGAFAAGAAWFLAELNAIHLFREGNGRTQTAFLAMLSAEAGHPLDLSRIEESDWMAAMVHSFYVDERELATQIKAIIAD